MHSVSLSNIRFNFTILLVFILCFNALFEDSEAKKHHKKKKSKRKARQSGYISGGGGNLWTLKSEASGSQITDFFNFESVNQGSQGGIAQYVDLEEGYRSSIVGSKDGTLYLGVDTTKHAENRKSIRISSKDTFSPGTLLVVDILHMPAACGAWPALWTVAKDGEWPEHGEIDIIEGVNMFTQNSLSAHTKTGFWMKSTGFHSKFMLDGDQQTNCDASATNDQGCGLRDPSQASFGEPFNAAKGGIHVMEWTNEAINIFFFPRDEVPGDIASGHPSKSSSWGQPRARFQGSGGQSTGDYFKEHVLVINTNLCGQWPEGVWNSAATYAGQPKSCAAMTGYSTCQDFIANAGDQLHEAYWAIKSVKVYN
ncbi:family 16 glycoside hydrolase [Melampsora larici-populina 98AG31]|uniref:Family 16 glycoside hydrolase n=1 Tax=Melampsora larici-populina (strain 98AG31 / pathotype 3-4-7) TaxID=747676 RepID=F4RE99_MELLP|nr:family 16 glycoside hydrolase [Melampsora larici-populina 98AG31]EGG09306.1 family 16 glycoside hydrolase [Melampsora larici-populina 98AG31]